MLYDLSNVRMWPRMTRNEHWQRLTTSLTRIVYFWPDLQITNLTGVVYVWFDRRILTHGLWFLCLARFSYHESYTILSLFTRTVTRVD